MRRRALNGHALAETPRLADGREVWMTPVTPADREELAAELHAVSGNVSITREEVSRWERGKRIPGPYRRTWLGRVLGASQQELEQAVAMARRTRRRR